MLKADGLLVERAIRPTMTDLTFPGFRGAARRASSGHWALAVGGTVAAVARQPQSERVVDTVIGRSAELAALDSLLDHLEVGVGGLWLGGEAGIGTSTVWREGVRRASERGFGVLVARPTEAEVAYAFAGLGDLLADVDDPVRAVIPEPQRRALEAALLITDAPEDGIDERAIGAGLLSLLRALAQDRPQVIAVDDVQWLDLPTRRALAFAARRLRSERVGFLLTAHTGDPSDPSLDRALPPDAVERLELGPLSVGALHALFKEHLGRSFSLPVLGRIAKACRGNPLYALEVARELERAPKANPGLPVPAALGALVDARLARLPGATRESLLAAASLARPTVERIGPADFAPAIRAGIVRIEDGEVRFTHPLYASAVYRSASDRARQAMHRKLAAGATEPEDRARHLALGSPTADAGVASLLDEAAERAMARGAPSTSIELLELALRLTPAEDDEGALRRTVALTRGLFDTGDGARAEAILDRTLETAPPGPLRREAMVQLGWWLTERGDWAAGVGMMEAALTDENDPRAAGRTEVMLAEAYRLNLPVARQHAGRALELLDPGIDPGLYSKALQLAVEARLLFGDGADSEGMARSLALQDRASGTWEVSQFAAGWARGMDDLDAARERFSRLIDVYEEQGLDSELPGTLGHLATVELWSGRWQRAESLARRARELADQTEYPVSACLARYALGLVLVQRGELDEARSAANATLEVFADRPAPILETQARIVLGEADLSAGDATEALNHFERADELLASIGWREPFHFRYQGDQIEALVRVGRLDDATALVTRLEESAARIPRPWIAAVAARGRAMVLTAEGEPERATEAFDRALQAHEVAPGSFERGRTLLAMGRIQRRARQKRLARTSLEAALGVFEEQGALGWAEQTRAELRRVATRTTPADLTATELLIARLAASGLTNEEIADRAFVSPKTVEANLARAYAKLGIGRRAQLAHALDEREAAAIS